jgi:hypothetical protein
LRPVDPLPCGSVPLELLLELAEVERQGHEPLLSPIVEVALQALAFLCADSTIRAREPRSSSSRARSSMCSCVFSSEMLSAAATEPRSSGSSSSVGS